MLKIEYINEDICGEPAPNFYWSGNKKDFLNFLPILWGLASNEKEFIELTTNKAIVVSHPIKMIVKTNGKILNKKYDNFILMELDIKIWQNIMLEILNVSFEESHIYMDFDELNLEEDANYILESLVT